MSKNSNKNTATEMNNFEQDIVEKVNDTKEVVEEVKEEDTMARKIKVPKMGAIFYCQSYPQPSGIECLLVKKYPMDFKTVAEWDLLVEEIKTQKIK